MVLALKCMTCGAIRMIDRLENYEKLENCQVCGHKDVFIMKTYNWKSLLDVDTQMVHKDEEDFENCAGEFAEEHYDENDDRCTNGKDPGECDACPHFERCMNLETKDTQRASSVIIKAMRTYDGIDKFGCAMEVCVSKDGHDLYVYCEKGERFLFRVCNKSYYEYMEHDDDEAFPIHIYKEIVDEIKEDDAEYFSLLGLVMDLADKITKGIRIPRV